MTQESSKRDLSELPPIAGQCTCTNLRKTTRVITQLYDEFLQPSGLLATQLAILGAIASKRSIALTPLAEQMLMDPTTLARNLRPLVRDGLVEISRGADRRQRILKLTDRGEKALAKALPLWQQAQAYVIKQIGADRQQAMLRDWSDLVARVRK